MKPHLAEAATMLRLADRGITAYTVLCNTGEVHFSIICFHAQQAIEKCLRAALLCQNIEFRRTHDLPFLTDLLAKHGVRTPLIPTQLAAINPCAVLLRYDEVETEAANVDLAELSQMVASTRAWAAEFFRAPVSAEADA